MKKILLTCFMLVFVLYAWAQDRTVSGKVTDAQTGESLPGVNVLLKGTGVGTNTDLDGNYKISVPSEGGTLTFSFIGMKTMEEAIGARSVINVQMKTDVAQLSEVVVTGYGSQLKREITGSVASVKGDVIEDLPLQSFDRAIQGRVSGTQIQAASGAPGGAMNIRIRGIGSINSGNDPLIIIDGVQVTSAGQSTQGSSNPLNSINPNDIESIDILKDAAASAIYGAQAANGVIVVTTKTGSKKGATQVNISVQEGVVQPFNLYDVLDAQDFTRIKEEAQLNVGADPNDPNTGSYALFGNPEDPSSYTEYDWVDNMFQDARFSNYDISMTGGNEKTSFYFGGSYNSQDGQVIMSNFERYTGRLNLSHQATEKLTVGAKLSLAHVRNFGTIANGNFVNGPWVASFEASPTSPAVDADGNYNGYPSNGLYNHLFGYNILQGVNEEVRLGRTLQTVSSASATYQITPSLSASAFVGLDFSMNRDDNQRPSTIPVFAASGGSIFVNNRRSIAMNTNYNINYSKTFNDVHTVKALVGYEYKFEQREGASLGANSFANPFFRLPGDGQPTSVGGFFQEYKRLGIFGKVDYDYDDKYLASVTVRRDGHSRFGSKSKYGTFYAGSVGWRVSEESFLSDVSFISDLKLKGSYGVLGNAEIGNYESLTTWGGSSGQYLGNSTVTITQLGNDEISWEEEESMNIGIDYSLFSNRVFGNVDVWRTNNNGLLFNVPFFQNAGVNNNSVTANVGSVRNQGVDVEVGAIVADAGGFRWDARFNISFLKNEVTELVDSDTIFAGSIPSLIVGQPVSFFYLLNYAGVNPANGRAMIVDKDGNLSYTGDFEDGSVVGNPIPTHFGGFSNTFSFKGLTLDVFFQYQYGNDAFTGDFYNLLSGDGVGNQLNGILDRWQQPGDVTNVPMVTPNGTINGVDQSFGFIGTDRFMSDASYIRLKTLTLSYDLPASVMDALRIRSARFFVQGVNLVTWTKYNGIDPEVVANNNANGASSFGVYPLGRQFSAGINLGL